MPALYRRAKLFRFEKGSSEWKERGTGDCKLLQDKKTRIVRVVMRRDKTLKVCANHLSASNTIPRKSRANSWLSCSHLGHEARSQRRFRPIVGVEHLGRLCRR